MAKNREALKKSIWKIYAQGNRTQREIAKDVNTSQSSVSRFIREGIKKGKIKANHEPKRLNIYRDTRSEICEKYGLKDIIILHSPDLESATGITYFQRIGELTARYLEDMLEPDIQISVAHGRSVHYTIKALKERRLKLNVDPLMLIRGLGVEAGKIPAWANAVSLGLKYWSDQTWEQFIPQYLEVDVKGEKLLKTADRMFEKDIVKRALSRIGDSNVILQGVGPLYKEATFARVAKKLDLEYYELVKLGIAGSICHTPVDQNANPITLLNLHKLAITITLDRLRQLSRDKDRHIILIAGGEEKLEIIKTTLEGGYCNILATDENVASRLLDDDIV